MGKEFSFYDRLIGLEKITGIDTIDKDCILIDNSAVSSVMNGLFRTCTIRLDSIIAIVCKTGIMKWQIDMKPQTAKAPGFMVILPNQVLELVSISEDFSGLFIIMSAQFARNLNLSEGFLSYVSIRENPFIPLNEDDLKTTVDYFYSLQKVAKAIDNPYRMEIAGSLTRVFYYSTSYLYHKESETKKKTKHETLIENFLVKVQQHYKVHRSVIFYAERLDISPKYLSKLIKENTGRSANEWIDSYVLIESKTLLKSTNMTIQQISDILNFPSQSFFGKYFRRLTGLSPKEYRKSY